MRRRPPKSTRTDTLFPNTTLFRSDVVLFAGGVPKFVAAGAEQGYKLAPEALEAAIGPKTKWVILNSPSNPTGAGYTAAELKALGEVIERHPDVWVFADDMYEHIVYDGFERSEEHTSELQSLMRISYAVFCLKKKSQR